MMYSCSFVGQAKQRSLYNPKDFKWSSTGWAYRSLVAGKWIRVREANVADLLPALRAI